MLSSRSSSIGIFEDCKSTCKGVGLAVIVRYPRVHFDQSWGNIALGKLMFIMFIVSQFHGGQHISNLV
ncbi:Lysophospholipid acyltransferase LPEAT2 [Camellia lanceoleosa]|uniref:Lysophospholipid acyltransferase LPEAT2 n=1 Tax=Camellia lanceoleosa TaxID=1840588 RepID=A0ACC0IPY1_9ERIC|nr:Lysophospholipid acyltransferase LPEAT2 [Camellia lanceoleosa]